MRTSRGMAPCFRRFPGSSRLVFVGVARFIRPDSGDSYSNKILVDGARTHVTRACNL